MSNINSNKVCIISLGCAKNLVDSEILIGGLSEDGTSIGRSYRDAPEVDNFVRIKEQLPVGEFVDVKITEAFEYNIKGETLIHEPETI